MDFHLADRRNLGAFAWRRSWPMLLLLLSGAAPRLPGQTSVFNQFNPLSSTSQGVHLYGVSVFSGYYSKGVPYGNGLSVNISPGAAPSYDVSTGAVASLGWNRSGERSSISAGYSPSYFASVRHSEYNQLNHNFWLNGTRRLGDKWSLGVTAAGLTASMEQLAFTPTPFTSVASLPTTFDDLTSAVLAGKYSSSQLASLLTGTPLGASPDQSYLYGERILSGTLGLSLSYVASGRSTYQITASGARTQLLHVPGTSNSSGTPLIRETTSASASVGWSFSLTPRTQIGVTAMSTRAFSRFEDGYATSLNFSIGRTMSRRWFVQARGGAGTLIYQRRTFPSPRSAQYLAGGGIGFKTYAHTFMAAYDRSLADGYGLGSSSTGSATGAWNWKRPGSGWSVFSSYSYQRLSNPALHNPTSWQAGAGVARALSSHFFANVQYSYLKFPYLTSAGVNFSQNGVVAGLNWTPSNYQ